MPRTLLCAPFVWLRRRAAVVLVLACLVAGRADAASPPIVVVRGTVSTPDAGERNYADRLAVHMSGWLAELGIRHRVIDDEAVPREIRGRLGVVVLPYNPYPPAAEVAALGDFVGRGGKLLVLFCSEPALAEVMGMRLGEYQSSGPVARWRAIRFLDGAVAGMPARISQQSRNVRPALAVEGRSRVIAAWEDAHGRALVEPAWTESGAGMWMSHVLLDDGDTENKKQMLAALVGHYLPAVWRDVAGQYLQRATDPFSGLDGAEARLRRLADGTAEAATVLGLVGKARELRRSSESAYRRGRYPEAVVLSRQVAPLLTTAYARVQTPRRPEFRGAWDHSGAGLYPGDWLRTCRVLKGAGIDHIFPNVLWPMYAHYPGTVVPSSELAAVLGDQLEQCVAAAREYAVGVHVWKVCWRCDKATDAQMSKLRAAGRLQASDTGQELAWLCPSHPDNIRHEKDSIRDVLSRYPVQGIHLDYIRYNNSHYCYCSGCRTRFVKETRARIARWPADVRRGSLKRTFSKWRTEQVTRLVRDVGTLARKVRPGVKVSAAVYGRYPLCAESVGQDWGLWLKEGYVDFVCPMDYTEDLRTFKRWVGEQMDLPAVNRRIFPGIGATAAESHLHPVEVIDQIVALRELGARGFVLYQLNASLAPEVLPMLRLGVTR